MASNRTTPMRSTQGRNLTYGLVQELGLAIVTGVYDENNPFPIESALCTQFGASRSVLREAVKMLTTKGLLSARPRQGTRIEPETNWNLLDPDILRWLMERRFSISLLREFTEIRLAMEPAAAALAAQRASRAQLKSVKAAMARMHAAARGDDDPLLSDIALHVAILEASGNRFFAQLSDMIETALRISIRLTNRLKGVAFASIDDHQRVVDAISTGRSDEARDALAAMIRDVLYLIDLHGSVPGEDQVEAKTPYRVPY